MQQDNKHRFLSHVLGLKSASESAKCLEHIFKQALDTVKIVSK